MRSAKSWTVIGLAFFISLAAPAVGWSQNSVVSFQKTVNEDGGSVDFSLDDGTDIAVRVVDGKILINGNEVASFDRERVRGRWREILSSLDNLDNEAAVASVADWDEIGPEISSVVSTALSSALAAAGVSRSGTVAMTDVARQVVPVQQDGRGRDEISELLSRLQESDNVELNLGDARIVVGATEVARDEVVRGDLVVLGGEVAVKGRVTGDILAFGGDIRLFRGANVGGDVVSVDGSVTGSTSLVAGTIRSINSDLDLPAPRHFARFEMTPQVSGPVAVGGSLMTLLATLVAFASIGFGLTFFAPVQLEKVSARVVEHPGRSFMAGLFAQPLLLPLLAMLIVGLAVSIVGIILIPFAVIAAGVVVGAMTVMGYMAVANSLGARHAKQRAARLGKTANPTQLEALIRGLIIVMAVWLPAVLLSWVPFAGFPVAALALVFTWVIATAGFGAVITTKAGFEGQLPWQRKRRIES